MLPQTKGTTLMRRLYGTTIGRALSLFAALAMVAGAGFMVAGTSSASTNFGPGTVRGALVSIDANATRGEYLDANGIHHCLPEGPNSSWTWETGDYPAMAFIVTDPSCDFGVASKPPVSAVKPPVTTTGEAAPTLSANGDPGLTSIPLKWSKATPPSDDTVILYQVRYEKTSTGSWSVPLGVGNVFSYSLVVPSNDTQYFVQVRAQYNTTSGGFGPWSNTLTATTDTP